MRKDQEKRLAQVEQSARLVPIEEVETRKTMRVPKVERQSRTRMGNILYRKPKDQIREAAAAMGNRNMSYKDVGLGTFEYYWKHEVEDG